MSKKSKTVNWGIIGTSIVSSEFCSHLVRVPGARMVQILSGKEENAAKFAKQFSVQKYTASIDEFLKNSDIDVVYIASPTSMHEQHAKACIEKGIAVLCEKPFVTDSDALKSIQDLAREKKVFCMEAMWMRFNPLIQKVKKIIDAGDLGTISNVRVEIGYNNPADRLKDPSRGALWDFSVYAVSLLQLCFGKPKNVTCIPKNQETASAGGFSAIMNWDELTASISSYIDVELANEVVVYGSKAVLRIGAPFFCPTYIHCSLPIFEGSKLMARLDKIKWAFFGQESLAGPNYSVFESQAGFYYEAEAVTEAIKNGETECDLMSHADSLEVLEVLESMQRSCVK